MSITMNINRQQQQQQNSITPENEKLLRLIQLNKMKALKLERLTQYNNRLKEELSRDRINVSNSSLMVIQFTENTKDCLIPEIWGELPVENNKFKKASLKDTYKNNPTDSSDGCCIIM